MRVPGWLVFLVFVPLQIWFFLEMRAAWGIWAAALTFLVLGLIAGRAARVPWLMSALFPTRAERRERRRHVYQGILFLIAAGTFFLPWGPQPWLPAAALASLVKSSVR